MRAQRKVHARECNLGHDTEAHKLVADLEHAEQDYGIVLAEEYAIKVVQSLGTPAPSQKIGLKTLLDGSTGQL